MISKKAKKRIFEYSFIFVLLVGIILIYLAVANQVADIFAMSKTKDYDSVKLYLQEFGIMGAFIIAILEMLQMIVIFIPAEFVQIAAGLAYPIYYAVPICVFGICLGASVIFLIVRCLHLRMEIMEKRVGNINKLVKKINRPASISIIMYLLFVMPLIPFGAICYFAASSEISYRRYILVVATGVLPSVLSSFVLGNVMALTIGTKWFILAVCVVAIGFFVLLFGIASIIKNYFFYKPVQRPGFISYHVIFFFVRLFFWRKVKFVKKDCPKIKDKSYIILGAHTSAIDFVCAAKAVYPRRINVVANRFFVDYKPCRFLMKTLHVIPKRLFTPDTETIKKMFEAKKKGLTLYMCPEGRLSSSGAGYPVTVGTANLIKKLAMPVYFESSVGGYFAKPKWRKKYVRYPVEITIEQLLSAEQVSNMSEQEIQAILDQKFNYDECAKFALRQDVKKNSVDVTGLENVLFVCPSCKKEFVMTSQKDRLICEHCKEEFIFNDNYLTSSKTISTLYNEQKLLLSEEEINLKDFVKVKAFDNIKGELIDCGEGECTIKEGEIRFEGKIFGQDKTFVHTLDTLQALAFSAGEEFEFYVDKKLYYFYPQDNKTVVKWSILWDILQERKANEEKTKDS